MPFWTMCKHGEGLATMFISRQLFWLCVQLQWLLVKSCPSMEVMQPDKHRGSMSLVTTWDQRFHISWLVLASSIMTNLWYHYLLSAVKLFFSSRSVHAWCYETACDSEKHMCGRHWGVSKLIFVQFPYMTLGCPQLMDVVTRSVQLLVHTHLLSSSIVFLPYSKSF